MTDVGRRWDDRKEESTMNGTKVKTEKRQTNVRLSKHVRKKKTTVL